VYLIVVFFAAGVAAASTIDMAKPDLALEAPTTSIVGAAPRLRASWVVHNTGTVATPATQLEVRCTPVYTEDPLTACEPMHMIDIPPLAKGDHFLAVQVAASFTSQISATRHFRFNLSGRLDPNNLIAESNEQNNALTFIAENFQGLPPSNISAAPQVPAAAPVMQLATNPPWNPTKSTWIEVKNVGPYDAPALSVTVTCYKGSHPIGVGTNPSFGPIDEKPCGSVVSASQAGATTILVPAIQKGQFKAIYEVKSFVPPMTLSNDPIYMPMGIRFHLVGASAADLMLTNKR